MYDIHWQQRFPPGLSLHPCIINYNIPHHQHTCSSSTGLGWAGLGDCNLTQIVARRREPIFGCVFRICLSAVLGCVGREAEGLWQVWLFTQTAQHQLQHTARNLIIVMRVIYCADSSLLLAANQNFIPLPVFMFCRGGPYEWTHILFYRSPGLKMFYFENVTNKAQNFF